MDKTMRIVDVGVAQSGKQTSPIALESDEDFDVMRQEVADEAVCWFNDQQFGHDDVVFSGNDILRCDKGIWLRAGRREG
jgi:hypothetical protein